VQGSGTTPWVNGVYQDSLTCWGQPGDTGYCGPNGIVRPGNHINFSYGSSYLFQQQNVASLLPNDIGNIKVTGYQFGFQAKNGNGWDDGRTDQLTALVRFWDSTGGRGSNNLLYGTSWNLSYNYNWTNFNYNETLPTALDVKNIGQVQYGFIGRDNNGWAGPYGPEITNISFRLKYSIDPCATNPAYATTCAGFNTVLTSNNLVPNANGVAQYGGSINNSFGIQTALQHSGTGMTVHGFNYGYNVWAKPAECGFDLFGCWWWNPGGSAQVNVGITNASGNSLYAANRQYNESGYSSQNFQYRFPSSLNQLALGSFNFTASTSGDAYVSNMYSRILYSQDPCFFNSNYSAQCNNKPTPPPTAPPSGMTMAAGLGPIDVGGVQLSSDGSISAPGALPPPPPGSPPPPTGMEPGPGNPPPPSTIPTPGSPPPAGNSSSTAMANASGPVQQQGGKSGGSAPNMSLVMSTISRVQAADRATQNAAVANAQQVVATSSAAAQAQANQVVDQANALSAESSQASQTLTSFSMQQGNRQQQTSSSSFVALQGPTVMSIQALTASSNQSQSITGDTSNIQRIDTVDNPIYSLSSNNIQRYTPGLSLSSTNNVAMVIPQIQLQQQTQQRFDTRIEQEQPQIFQPPQTALARGTILGDILEQRLSFGSFQMEQQMDTVKKNVLPNELAGGVDLAAMALMPKGYEAYSIVTLRDVPFYKSEAIYKDQRTIDNARVFRGLTGGSDAKHQEMVDQQYKLRN
jgi:hypothetical protein